MLCGMSPHRIACGLTPSALRLPLKGGVIPLSTRSGLTLKGGVNFKDLRSSKSLNGTFSTDPSGLSCPPWLIAIRTGAEACPCGSEDGQSEEALSPRFVAFSTHKKTGGPKPPGRRPRRDSRSARRPLPQHQVRRTRRERRPHSPGRSVVHHRVLVGVFSLEFHRETAVQDFGIGDFERIGITHIRIIITTKRALSQAGVPGSVSI